MRDSYVLDTMLSPSYILTSLVCTSTHCSGVYCYLHFTGKETEAQSCQGSWPRCSSLLVSGRAGTCTQAVWFHSCSPVLIILMCYLRTALDQSWGPRVPVFDVTPAVSSSAKNLVSYKLWSPEQCACCHRAIVRPPSLLAHHDDTFFGPVSVMYVIHFIPLGCWAIRYNTFILRMGNRWLLWGQLNVPGPQSVSDRTVTRSCLSWLRDNFSFCYQMINCGGLQVPTWSGVWSLRSQGPGRAKCWAQYLETATAFFYWDIIHVT